MQLVGVAFRLGLARERLGELNPSPAIGGVDRTVKCVGGAHSLVVNVADVHSRSQACFPRRAVGKNFSNDHAASRVGFRHDRGRMLFRERAGRGVVDTNAAPDRGLRGDNGVTFERIFGERDRGLAYLAPSMITNLGYGCRSQGAY